MNKIYRVVWNATTGEWVVASEMAKGRKKKSASGRVLSTAIVSVLAVGGIVGQPAQAEVAITADPVNGSTCERDADDNNGLWSESNEWWCHPGAGTGASGVGRPITTALFYASNRTSTYEDSLSLGGYLDVWNTATFWNGASMEGTKITKLAAGTANTDAVNVGQLKTVATALGGGSVVDANGNVTKPTYTIGGKTYTGVDSAITALDSKPSSSNPLAVAYDDSNKAKATLQGGNGTVIANVAAGAVSLSSKDAINGSQLFGTANSVANALGGASSVDANGNVTKPTYLVDNKSVSGVDGAISALDSRITNSGGGELAAKVKFIKIGQTAAMDASANGVDTVAIGGFAQANGDGSLAIGANARAFATNAVAIGQGSSTTTANTFAVGSTSLKRRIVNVADGVGVTDAVTVGQMNTKIAEAMANGGGLKSSSLLGGTSMLGAVVSSLTPDKLIVAGPNGQYTTPTDAVGDKAIAIGLNTHANANDAVAVGQNVSVLGANGVGVGQMVGVGSVGATAIGSMVSAVSDYATAIGSDTEVNTGAEGAVAIGRKVSIGGANTVAIGSDIIAAQKDNIILGGGSSDDNRSNIVSVGSSGVILGTAKVQRQIINVAKGTLDTDAVNVSQLKGVTAALGGGAGVDASGNVTKPSYTVGGNTVTGVDGAIAALDAKNTGGSLVFTGNDATAGTVTRAAGQTLAIQGVASTAGTYSGNNLKTVTDPTTGAIKLQMADSPKFGNVTVNDGGTGRISGVADGVGATDAVNKGQAEAMVANAGKWRLQANGGTADTITSADTVNVADGSNTTVAYDAATNKLQVNVVANPTFTSVTAGNSKLDTNGLVITGGPSMTTSGINAGGKVISNVAQGIQPTDAVNISQLKDVATALGAGAGIDATGKVVKPDYDVDGTKYADVGGALDAVEALAKGGSALAVTYDTSAKDKVSLSPTGTTLTNVKDGLVAAGSKDAVTGNQLYATNQLVDGLSKNPLTFTGNSGGAVARKLGEALAIQGVASTAGTYSGNNLKTVTDPATGAINLQMADSPKFGNVTVNDGGTGRISGVADGVGATDAVNKGQAEAMAANAGKWRLQANGGTADTITSADTVNVADGSNTTVAYDAATNKLQVNVVANPTFTSVTAGNSKLDTNGLVITGGPSMTTSGINAGGKVISNVADGALGSDAVNKAQLDRVEALAKGGSELAVTYDTAAKDKVSLNPTGTTLTNLKDGEVAAGSKDAVTGNQLNTTNQNVTNLTTSITNGTVGLVQQTAKGQKLTVGKATDGLAVDFTGTAGTRQLNGVSKGLVNTDAVNVSQLKGVTDVIGGDVHMDAAGNVTKPNYVIDGNTYNTISGAIGALDAKAGAPDPLAVLYNDESKDRVVLGGAEGTVLTNVKDGLVAAGSKDAVTGNQLNTTNQSIANLTTNITNGKVGLVQQASPSAKLTVGKDTAGTAVDFTGTAGSRQLKGVSKGVADTDAVNLAQLKAAGLVVDGGGNPVNTFVAYDDATKGKVTLQGGAAGTTIANVKAGVADNDAVNVKQLKDAGLIDGDGEVQKAVLFNGPAGEANLAGMKAIDMAAGAVNADSKEGINGSQLYNTANSVAEALGGGSTVGPNGEVTKPVYTVDGKDAVGVDGAVGALDSRIDNLNQTLEPQLKYVKFGYTTALDASANGTNAVAIGGFAQANGDGALAIGAGSRAFATNAVAIGQGSSTTAANTVAVGSTTLKRRIVNVADGVGVTDAVTVGQMNTKIAEAMANGGGLKSSSVLGGTSMLGAVVSSLTPDKLIVAGPNGQYTTPTDAVGDKAIAIGLNTHANANDAVAVGQNVSVLGANGVGVGQMVGVGSVGATAIGSMVSAVSDYATAIGSDTEVNTGAEGAVAIGRKVSIGGANTVAIGSDIIAAQKDNIILGGGSSDDNRSNIVSVGSSGVILGTAKVQRQIINVAKGTLDTDAVNVSQLKGVTAALGGGAAVDSNGNVTKPAYTIGEDTYGTVAEALDALAKNGTPAPEGVVLYDTADHDKVTLGGADGTTIANVKAGVADNEAVNVKQLKDAGLIDDGGEVQKAVLFNGPAGEANLAGMKIINMAAGGVSADSKQGINGSQLYNTANSVAAVLGGTGGGVDADGKVKAPKYTIGNTDYTDVGSALAAVDAKAGTGNALGVAYDGTAKDKVTLAGGANGTTISNLKAGVADTDAVNVKQLKDSGLIDGQGNALNAVTYDSAAKDTVTLGGTGATKKVRLKNVADAQADDEAVNLAQLKRAGLVDGGGSTVLDAVVYDAGSNKGIVTFGGGKGTVLANVADGRIETGSRQAVNGGQIASLRDELRGQITNIDARVTSVDARVTEVEQNGGGSSGLPNYVSVNGSVKTAKANVGTTPGVALGYGATALGDGASAIGDNATAAAKDSVSYGNNARVTAGATGSVALGNGSVADRANTVSVGSAGRQRTITNVAAGTADTDAVNVGQLNQRLEQSGSKAVAEANAYTDRAMDDMWQDIGNEVDHKIDQASRQANRGIAAASALINVTPYVPGHTTVNAGVASYRDEAALGVGVSRWSENGRVNVNAGVSAAKNDEPIFRVGIGYIF